MSKGICSYPEDRRMSVAMRRTAGGERGCGYWAAVSFLNRHGIKTKEQTLADAVNEVMRNSGMDQRRSRIADNVPRSSAGKRGTFSRRFKPESGMPMSDQNRRTLAGFRGGR